MPNTVIKFHGPQEDFFKAGPQPTLFMGGVGSGKSYVGILKMLALLDLFPGSRGAIVRQKFSALKKTTAATLWKLLPKEQVARRNDNEGIVYLKNGSQLILMHLDKADSIDNLKSLELNFAYVDQAEDISADAFDILQERIGRWSGASMRGGYAADWPFRTIVGEPIPPAYIFISAYSPGYDHWITARFWEDGSDRENFRKEGYMTLVGSTRDNPNLTKIYIKGRLARGKAYVERFVDASTWGANEGAIFDLTDASIVEPTQDLLVKIKTRMRLHRVMDHGEAVPTACLWYATDSDQNVFFYREYGQPDLLVSDHRYNIYQLSKPDFPGDSQIRYHSNLADPIIFAKSRGRGVNRPPQWSVANEWQEKRTVDVRTAVTWRPANNDESMTLNRVQEYLRPDPNHRNPITGEMGSPRIFFLKKTLAHTHGMHETLKDVRSAKRVELVTSADGTKQFGDDRDSRVRDHWLDCVRYSIGMRPSLGKTAQRETPKDGSIRIDEYYKLTEEMEEAQNLDKLRNWDKQLEYGY